MGLMNGPLEAPEPHLITSGVFSLGKKNSTVRIPEVRWRFVGLMKDSHEAAA